MIEEFNVDWKAEYDYLNLAHVAGNQKNVKTIIFVVVELPRLLYTVVGRKPANPPPESDDIRGIHLDKFPVGQERLPSLLTPRRTFPQEMFSVFFFDFACFACSVIV